MNNASETNESAAIAADSMSANDASANNTYINATGLDNDGFHFAGDENVSSMGKEGDPATAWIKQAMAHLPMDVRVEMARSAARRQDVRVLWAMARRGAFLFTEDSRPIAWREAHFADEEIPIVAALACVLEGATTAKVLEGGVGVHSEIGAQPRELSVSREFREFLTAQVVTFITSFDQWWQATKIIDSNEVETPQMRRELKTFQMKRFRATLCVLLAAACAMDEDKLCRSLAMCEHFETMAVLRPTILGRQANESILYNNSSRQVNLYPWVLGYEFNSVKSLDVVAQYHGHGALRGGVLSSHKVEAPQVEGSCTVPGLISSGFLAVPAASFMALAGKLQRREIAGYGKDDKDGKMTTGPARGYLGHLVSAMVKGVKEPGFERYWKAGLAGGIQNFSHQVNRELVTAAISQSNSQAIRDMGDSIDWSLSRDRASLDKHHFSMALAQSASAYDETSDLLMALVEGMQASGHLQAYFVHQCQQGGNLDLEELVQKGFTTVIVEMLKRGLDPSMKNFKGQTLMQKIESDLKEDLALVNDPSSQIEPADGAIELREHLLNVLRSWQAHQSAMQALAELSNFAEVTEVKKAPFALPVGMP